MLIMGTEEAPGSSLQNKSNCAISQLQAEGLFGGKSFITAPHSPGKEQFFMSYPPKHLVKQIDIPNRDSRTALRSAMVHSTVGVTIPLFHTGPEFEYLFLQMAAGNFSRILNTQYTKACVLHEQLRVAPPYSRGSRCEQEAGHILRSASSIKTLV
jgi:hypothetical protein